MSIAYYFSDMHRRCQYLLLLVTPSVSIAYLWLLVTPSVSIAYLWFLVTPSVSIAYLWLLVTPSVSIAYLWPLSTTDISVAISSAYINSCIAIFIMNFLKVTGYRKIPDARVIFQRRISYCSLAHYCLA